MTARTVSAGPFGFEVPSRGRLLFLIVLYLLPVGILAVAWELASTAFANPVLFPGPGKTFDTFLRLLQDGSLIRNSAVSLGRVIVGFAAGSVLGVVLGLAMGSSRTIRSVLEPYVEFLRFVSAVAWISAFLVWFGIGETSKVLLLVYATTFGIAISVTVGVMSIAPNKRRAAACFGVTPWQMFLWITVPATVPHMIAGMRLALQNSFMAIVAAEMIAANVGLGYLIMSSRTFLAPDRIFVAIFALGVLGFLTDRVVMVGARLLLMRYQLPD